MYVNNWKELTLKRKAWNDLAEKTKAHKRCKANGRRRRGRRRIRRGRRRRRRKRRKRRRTRRRRR